MGEGGAPARLHVPGESKCDWPEDFSHENGNYVCFCCMCQAQFWGHKRRVVCRACAKPRDD